MQRTRTNALGPSRCGLAFCCATLVATLHPARMVHAQEAGAAASDQTPREVSQLLAAFEWRRQPGASACPDEATIERETERVLGRRVFAGTDADSAADVLVRGVVRPSSGQAGWYVKLDMRSSEGVPLGGRELRSEFRECEDLLRSLSLVMALMIDLPRERVAVLVQEATAAEAQSRPRVDDSDDPLRFQVMAGAALSAGLFSRIVAGVRAGALLEASWFLRLRLTTTLWPRTEHRVGSAGGTFFGWQLGLALCPRLFDSEPVQLSACAGGVAGAVHSRGLGLQAPESRRRLLAGPTAGVEASISLSQALSVWLMLEALFPIVRDRYVYSADGVDETFVHRARAVTGLLAVGLALSF